MLRSVRRSSLDGELITLSAADPLNLMGIIVPGPRVPALHTNSVSFRDGVPEAAGLTAVATARERLTASV